MDYKENTENTDSQDLAISKEKTAERVNKNAILEEILEEERKSEWSKLISNVQLLLSLQKKKGYIPTRDECQIYLRLASNSSVLELQKLVFQLIAKTISEYPEVVEFIVEFGGIQLFTSFLGDGNNVFSIISIFALMFDTEIGYKACIEMGIHNELIGVAEYFINNSNFPNFQEIISGLLHIFGKMLPNSNEIPDFGAIIIRLIEIFKKLYELHVEKVIPYFPTLLKAICISFEDPIEVFIDSNLLELVVNAPLNVPEQLQPQMFAALEYFTSIEYESWHQILLGYINFGQIIDFLKNIKDFDAYITCFRSAANIAAFDPESMNVILQNFDFVNHLLDVESSQVKVLLTQIIFICIQKGTVAEKEQLFASEIPLKCLPLIQLARKMRLLFILEQLNIVLHEVDISTRDQYFETFKEQVPDELESIQEDLSTSTDPIDMKIILFISCLLDENYPERLLNM